MSKPLSDRAALALAAAIALTAVALTAALLVALVRVVYDLTLVIGILYTYMAN